MEKKTYDFILGPCDTDSISFCRQDGTFFTKEERATLLAELNALFPETIKFEDDGFFPKVIAIKTKNYILLDENGKLKVKGSALKKSTSEKAIKEYFTQFIDYLVYDKQDKLVELYEKYVKEAMVVTDMSRWVTRKTITSKVLEGTRTNETKVMDAIEGSAYKEGDRIYTFYKPDESLCLLENFTGEYDKMKLVKKLHTATKTFSTVIDVGLFKNYALKKNQDDLMRLVEGANMDKDWEDGELVTL